MNEVMTLFTPTVSPVPMCSEQSTRTTNRLPSSGKYNSQQASYSQNIISSEKNEIRSGVNTSGIDNRKLCANTENRPSNQSKISQIDVEVIRQLHPDLVSSVLPPSPIKSSRQKGRRKNTLSSNIENRIDEGRTTVILEPVRV